MKLLYILFLCTAAFLHSMYSSAQHISIGAKGGIGVSVPDPHSSIDAGIKSYTLRTHASYAGGILGQYILGDIIGIETGILSMYTSYSRKDLSGSYLQQSLGWDANISVNSYQIPVQFMYIFPAGRNANMRIKLSAGIAMNWLSTGFLKRQENPLLVSSILTGIRIKAGTGKYGRLEYGLEYQYSLNGTYMFDIPTDTGIQTLHSRYSILSFNLYYFFFNR